MLNRPFIKDLLAELLELPKNRVIYQNPNAPRLTSTHATIRYFSFQQETAAEDRRKRDTDEYDVLIVWNATLELQLYNHEDGVSALMMLVHKLNKPSIIERCSSQGVAFFGTTAVQDITELIDETSWESRANVDLMIRFTESVNDDLPVFDTVIVNGALNSLPATTGKITKDSKGDY